MATRLNLLKKEISTNTITERVSIHCVFFISLIKFPLWFKKRFTCKTNFWDFMINKCWLVALAKITKTEPVSVSSSHWKKCWGLFAHYLLLVKTVLTLTLNSIQLSFKASIATWLFNMVVLISCAWNDSPHDSSNTQDMISLVSCCWNKWKSLFLEITKMLCEQHKKAMDPELLS